MNILILCLPFLVRLIFAFLDLRLLCVGCLQDWPSYTRNEHPGHHTTYKVLVFILVAVNVISCSLFTLTD